MTQMEMALKGTISPQMKKVAELCFLVGYEIANREERLKLNNSANQSK